MKSRRWFVTPQLTQWRYMRECGDYSGPFATFPYDPAPELHIPKSIFASYRGGAESAWSEWAFYGDDGTRKLKTLAQRRANFISPVPWYRFLPE